MVRLPFTKDAQFVAPTCPYCGMEMVHSADLADPLSLVFRTVRICQHMIECEKNQIVTRAAKVQWQKCPICGDDMVLTGSPLNPDDWKCYKLDEANPGMVTESHPAKVKEER